MPLKRGQNSLFYGIQEKVAVGIRIDDASFVDFLSAPQETGTKDHAFYSCPVSKTWF